jgi:hypothetical protein
LYYSSDIASIWTSRSNSIDKPWLSHAIAMVTCILIELPNIQT